MEWLNDDAGILWLRRAIAALLLAGFLGFLARGGDRPANPVLQPAPSTSAPVTTVPGPPASVLPGG